MNTAYRVGRKQPRNVYRITEDHPEGIYIGVFFDPDDALMAVLAMNTSWRLTRAKVTPEDEKPPVVV